MKQEKIKFPSEKVQVSVQMRPEIIDGITKTAKRLGISRAAYCRYLLNIGIKKVERNKELVIRYRLND